MPLCFHVDHYQDLVFGTVIEHWLGQQQMDLSSKKTKPKPTKTLAFISSNTSDSLFSLQSHEQYHMYFPLTKDLR